MLARSIVCQVYDSRFGNGILLINLVPLLLDNLFKVRFNHCVVHEQQRVPLDGGKLVFIKVNQCHPLVLVYSPDIRLDGVQKGRLLFVKVVDSDKPVAAQIGQPDAE